PRFLLFSTNAPSRPPSHPLSLHDALPISLSMGFLPRDPLFRDDTKGATPPLESPAGPLLVLLSFRYSRGCVIRTMFRQAPKETRSEEHTSELQSRFDLVCRLLLEKKKKNT